MVYVDSPAGNVNLPDAAVKSEPDSALRGSAAAPAYHRRLARAAVALRVRGRSDRSIAVEFGETDKPIAKAIRRLKS